LNDLAMRMSAGAADLVISRAGSTIFELALWGKPSIIIPIGDSQGDHQRQNAFSYARAGACEVIEESNLSPNILESEIHRLTSLPEQLKKMSASAHSFSRLDAAHTIATELVRIGIAHEQ
jgi:UDP-N-acetylglucosamine--N-acetylmuramyl-(pentapeptide) pyrophosphoryl-undecaprenol N-acetylglucosamine transferase